MIATLAEVVRRKKNGKSDTNVEETGVVGTKPERGGVFVATTTCHGGKGDHAMVAVYVGTENGDGLAVITMMGTPRRNAPLFYVRKKRETVTPNAITVTSTQRPKMANDGADDSKEDRPAKRR